MADFPQQTSQPNNDRYVIDLRTRFGSAFGASLARIAESALGFGYQVPVPVNINPETAFVLPPPPEAEEIEYQSAFGSPIYDRYVFTVKGVDYSLLLPPLVSLSSDKALAITEINDNDFLVNNVQGREVIESWGTEPFDIVFTGILVDMVNHKRPLDQLKQLYEVYKANEVIQCTSRLFNALGIRDIITRRIELEPSEYLDTQPYRIIARAYVPVELILN